MSERPLSEKIALVTGASRGIGAATAIALAGRGAHVILVARTVGGLEQTEGTIHANGGTATIAPLDLTDGDSIGRLSSAVGARWGRLDILMLNAAILGTLAPVPSIDAKEFSRLLTLNVGANQALIAAFDPWLRQSAAPRLIAMTSSVSSNPRAYWGGYAASKAALEALALAYADEMSGLGDLRVAIVDPGATATAMRTDAFPGEDPATIKQPVIVGEAIATLLESDFSTGYRVRVQG